jgi:hypothetical protein
MADLIAVFNAATKERREVTVEEWRNRATDSDLANFTRVDGNTEPPLPAPKPAPKPVEEVQTIEAPATDTNHAGG